MTAIFFVAGNDVLTVDGFGTGGYKIDFKVPDLSLESSEDIVIGNAAHFDNCLVL